MRIKTEYLSFGYKYSSFFCQKCRAGTGRVKDLNYPGSAEKSDRFISKRDKIRNWIFYWVLFYFCEILLEKMKIFAKI